KTALGPKRTGPLVGLARMLGPDYRLGYLFILPTVVLVLALVAYPFCYAIYLSMTRKYVGVPPVFVGFDNYVKITFDGFFQRAVVNSFIFTFGSVGVKLVLGMLMALVLTSGIRFRSFWTGVLLIPWVAPTVVSALNFLWIFDYSLGVLNYLLVKVFHLFYILTRGGPVGATQVLPVFTYEIAFGAQRLGEAIAVALYMLPALAAVIIVLARYMRKGRAR